MFASTNNQPTRTVVIGDRTQAAPDANQPNTTEEWLSYPHAAARLGISADAVRQRVKRGTLLASRGNDGQPRVLLPVERVREDRDRPTRTAAPASDRQARTVGSRAIQPTRGSIAALETRIAEMTAARDYERQQHQQAIQLLVERVDAAEVRAERAEQRLFEVLEQQRRPWWRRWL